MAQAHTAAFDEATGELLQRLLACLESSNAQPDSLLPVALKDASPVVRTSAQLRNDSRSRVIAGRPAHAALLRAAAEAVAGNSTIPAGMADSIMQAITAHSHIHAGRETYYDVDLWGW